MKYLLRRNNAVTVILNETGDDIREVGEWLSNGLQSTTTNPRTSYIKAPASLDYDEKENKEMLIGLATDVKEPTFIELTMKDNGFLLEVTEFDYTDTWYKNQLVVTDVNVTGSVTTYTVNLTIAGTGGTSYTYYLIVEDGEVNELTSMLSSIDESHSDMLEYFVNDESRDGTFIHTIRSLHDIIIIHVFMESMGVEGRDVFDLESLLEWIKGTEHESNLSKYPSTDPYIAIGEYYAHHNVKLPEDAPFK